MEKLCGESTICLTNVMLKSTEKVLLIKCIESQLNDEGMRA